jgi:D-threo-aldose 1-dehydrogenase
MDQRSVGRTGLKLTTIGFGCAGIGGLYRSVPRSLAEETIATAWDAGIRYFDVAPHYGAGLAERRTGDFLRDKPAGSYVLSTKVGRILVPLGPGESEPEGFIDPLPFKRRYDYSYDGIMRSVETSLARLGLGRVDILYVHDIGVLTHGREANDRHLRDLLDSGMRALEELKGTGTISAFGLGVNEVAVCLDVMSRAALDCILLAGRYTLLDRCAESELLSRCAEAKTSLVVGGVFNSGILATGAAPGAHFDYGPASEDILDRVRKLEEVAARHGIPLAAAALQFPLINPNVASVLIGTAKPASLTNNLGLLQTLIPEAAWAEFDALAMAPAS